MTPARLSFGTWQEFRGGPPVTFFTLTTCSPRPESAVSDAMNFAVDLWRHPERYTEAPYAVGAGAYDTVARCHRRRPRRRGGKLVERAGLGGMPGARCRLPPGPSEEDAPAPFGDRAARWLAARYGSVSELLNRAADKSASAADKRRLIAEARAVEASCVDRIGEIRDRLPLG